jgi:ectoine hydroxylase-related dioxygenase (phytanoyl-CoA dioxygenase family)
MAIETAGRLRAAAAEVERDGCAVIPGVFSPAALDGVRAELDAAVAAGAVKAASRTPLTPEAAEAFRQLAARGEAALAEREPMVYVRDPMVTCPAAVPIVFSDAILDVTAAYYGRPAAVIGPRMVESFANDLPTGASTVHHFHLDYRTGKYLKLFIYLLDVDESGGPFCFVAGSHLRKPDGWREHAWEWSRDEIERFYGADAIRVLTARQGDLIVADTRGFHRALKARSRHRTMLRMGTGLDAPGGPWDRLALVAFRAFTPKQAAAARFFELV